MKNLDQYIKNREIIKINNDIYIGNNQKEIENNYFDLAIKIIDDTNVEIYINKLYKDIKILKGSELLELEYVNEFINLLNKIFNLELSNDEIKNLNNCIQELYLEIRGNTNIDNINNIYSNLVIRDYIFNFNIKDNMLLIKLEFKKE